MPTFEITAPDGVKFRVTGPEGATAEEALAQVQAQHKPDIGSLAEMVGRAAGSPSGEPLRTVGDEAVRQTKEQAQGAIESFRKAFTNAPPQPDETSLGYLGRTTAAIPGKAAAFGKGIMQAAGVPFAPFIGAGTAAIGQPLAAVEHGIGKLIAPDIAAKETIGDVYERGRGDVATALSLAKPSVVPGPANVATARGIPTKEAIKSAAEGDYKVARNMDAALDPTGVGNWARTVKSQIQGPDIGITSRRAPDTFAALSDLENMPATAKVTIENIHTLRQELRDIAADPMAGSERKAAGHALDKLEEYMGNLPAKDIISGDPAAAWNLTRQADANYQASKLSELLDKKQYAAELRAAAANSGMNLPNNIRSRIASLLLNPKEIRGFSPQERAMMESIVQGTKTENAVRALSNVLGGGGGLGSTFLSALGGGAGFMTAGLPGAAAGATLPVAGAVLRGLSSRIALNRLGALDEMVRSRSPLAQTPVVSNAQASAPYVSGPLGQRQAIVRALLGGGP